LGFAQNQWNTSRADLAPYRQAGTAALANLQGMAGKGIDPTADMGYKPVAGLANPGEFAFNTSGAAADPSYAWRLNQGLAAVNSSAAAKGGFFSGNTLQALQDYGQRAASQEYQNQFLRYNQMLQNYMGQEAFNADQYNQAFNRGMAGNQNSFNQWYTLANMGQNAANMSNAAGSDYASTAGNLALNQGNNVAARNINQGNIWGGVLTNASNQFLSGWGQQQMLNQMKQNQFNPNAYGPGY